MSLMTRSRPMFGRDIVLYCTMNSTVVVAPQARPKSAKVFLFSWKFVMSCTGFLSYLFRLLSFFERARIARNVSGRLRGINRCEVTDLPVNYLRYWNFTMNMPRDEQYEPNSERSEAFLHEKQKSTFGRCDFKASECRRMAPPARADPVSYNMFTP